MNKEELKKRVADLDESIMKQQQLINQMVADMNALHGARQEALSWVERLDKEQGEVVNQE